MSVSNTELLRHAENWIKIFGASSNLSLAAPQEDLFVVGPGNVVLGLFDQMAEPADVARLLVSESLKDGSNQLALGIEQSCTHDDVGHRSPALLLRHDSRPHRVQRRSYAAKVQHGIEPTPIAAFYRARPGIGPGSAGMIVQIENVDDARPHGLGRREPL
jgi:hypothetical protein